MHESARVANAPPAFVVVAGPQASGKSTLAAALRRELLDRGERVALIELDQIAAMALPTLPGWTAAHRIFASVAHQWAGTAMSCVIAEGSGSSDEVAEMRRVAPAGSAVVVVAVTTAFEVAYSRAQGDPTRGISRDRTFLADVYHRWPAVLSAIGPDVVVDMGMQEVDESVGTVLATIGRARGELTGRPA